MEVIRNYPEVEEIIGVIKRIADNLDEMTRIMQIKNPITMTRIMQIKNPITMTPEKEKSILNSMYGVMAARPLPDYDPEILRAEIQDLKLENDRLQKREDIMFDFICSISCVRKVCSECKLNRPDKLDELGAKCAYLQGGPGREYIREEASNILKKLEEL